MEGWEYINKLHLRTEEPGYRLYDNRVWHESDFELESMVEYWKRKYGLIRLFANSELRPEWTKWDFVFVINTLWKCRKNSLVGKWRHWYQKVMWKIAHQEILGLLNQRLERYTDDDLSFIYRELQAAKAETLVTTYREAILALTIPWWEYDDIDGDNPFDLFHTRSSEQSYGKGCVSNDAKGSVSNGGKVLIHDDSDGEEEEEEDDASAPNPQSGVLALPGPNSCAANDSAKNGCGTPTSPSRKSPPSEKKRYDSHEKQLSAQAFSVLPPPARTKHQKVSPDILKESFKTSTDMLVKDDNNALVQANMFAAPSPTSPNKFGSVRIFLNDSRASNSIASKRCRSQEINQDRIKIPKLDVCARQKKRMLDYRRLPFVGPRSDPRFMTPQRPQERASSIYEVHETPLYESQKW